MAALAATNVHQVPSSSLRACFFGDSFTAGVGDETALGWVGRVLAAGRAEGIDVTGYNLGVRRETVPQIQGRWLGEAQPRLRDGDGYGVVLAGGVNDTMLQDGHERVAQPETLRALDLFARQSQAERWSVLVVGPALVADEDHNRRIATLSEAMRKRCDEPGLRYVDVASVLNDADWAREVAASDGAHPSSCGYARMSEVIYPAFIEWLRSLPDERQVALDHR
jgi:acyl-CoA thioesterase-1